MKVILSRKGFDSSYGGTASPILPDGTLLSLPIPSKAETVKYITPYAYADAAKILPECILDGTLILLGLCYGGAGILAGWIRYRTKDIR